MRKIIEFFVNNPIWANAVIVFTLAVGIGGISLMNTAFFPEVDPYRINVNVFYPGASPQEMEDGVTVKIEQSIKGLKGIEDIYSTSSENSTRVRVSAFQGTDMKELLAEVENAVNSINSYPIGAERPIVNRVKVMGGASQVAFIGVYGDQDLHAMKDASEKIKNDLLDTRVITQVSVFGFPEQEISIEVKEDQLLRYGIQIDEISGKIQTTNIDLSAGVIRGENEELLIRSRNRTTDIEKLKKIVIRSTESGKVLRLEDLANVEFKFAEIPYKSFLNGNRSMVIKVSKLPEEDLGEISEVVRKYVENFNEENSELKMINYYMFDDMLQSRINLLTGNGLVGLILVLIALGIFLNVRLSMWVAFGIPFSMLGMFAIGYMWGMTIDMISLFGMIMVVGILVDDGIVIAENIFSHFEMGKTPKQAAIDGTVEVMGSVTTSVLTTIVVFGALFFVEGMEMIQEMSFVVVVCLLFSLVEAFLVLPSHLASEKVLVRGIAKRNITESIRKRKSRSAALRTIVGVALILFSGMAGEGTMLGPLIMFPVGLTLLVTGILAFDKHYSNSTKSLKVRGWIDKIIDYMREDFFGEISKFVIKRYRLMVFVPILFGVFVLILGKAGYIQSTLFPNVDPDMFTVDVAFEAGEREGFTQDYLEKCTEVIWQVNDSYYDLYEDSIINYATVELGFSDVFEGSGGHVGVVRVTLDIEDKPLIKGSKVIENIREEILKLDESKIAKELSVGGGNQWGKPIEVSLFSENTEELLKARDVLKLKLKNLPELRNVKDDMPEGRKEVKLKMLPYADVLGLTANDVVRQIRQGFYGQEIQRLIRGVEEIRMWVRYPEEDRNSMEKLETMKIRTTAGLEVPLNKVATYSLERGYTNLSRENGKRAIVIDADLADADAPLIEIIKDIENKVIAPFKQQFPDVKLDFGGQQEGQQKSMNSLMYLAAIALILMLIILTMNFNSLFQGLLVLLVLPVGYFGAQLGHGIIHIQFSFFSVFGIVALMGVLVNDAVVFIDTYNRKLKNGFSSKESAYMAAQDRFRPIVLTSVTTVVGLLPIVSERSFQAQFLIPMAAAIAFGILFGTIFILIFLPALILFGTDYLRALRWIWTGDKPSREDVEPALKKINAARKKELIDTENNEDGL